MGKSFLRKESKTKTLKEKPRDGEEDTEEEKASRDSVGSEVATVKLPLVQDESRLSAKKSNEKCQAARELPICV